MCVMNVADWQMIEATLRENEPTFSVKYIREHIQSDSAD